MNAKSLIDKGQIKLTPMVSSLKGTFSFNKSFDYKEELEKRLFRKYLKLRTKG